MNEVIRLRFKPGGAGERWCVMSRRMSGRQRAKSFIARWGDPLSDRSRGIHEASLIKACRYGVDPAQYQNRSTSEWITLVLGIGRHDLLPELYADPVDAWSRLDRRQREIVRDAIGQAPWMLDVASFDGENPR